MRVGSWRRGHRVASMLLVAALVAIVAGWRMPWADASPGTGEAPAGPGPDAFEVRPLTLEVMTGPDRDLAVTIDADLWVPESATSATPAPAVLTTHGFGNTKDANEQLANAAYFASHGYVVLSYTSMGFGGSSSCIGLDSLDFDVPSASAAIDHLASLPFVDVDVPRDPKVGMVGGSYGGGLQGLVAATDARLDAIAIGRSWNTLQYALDPNNWIPEGADPFDLDATEQGVFKQGWTSLFFALGASTPASGGGCDPATQQAEFPGQPPCPGFVPAICPTFARLSATGDAIAADRELVGRSSVATVLDRVDTPTLLLQGLPDTLFTPTEAAATYRALRDQGVPTAMIWHSGGHGGYLTGPGEAEAYSGQWDASEASQAEFATGYLPRRTLQWFERHVRGDRVDTGPAFTWFRAHLDGELDATGSAAPAYGSADDFPVSAADALTLVLDPTDGALVPDAAGIGGGSTTMLSPAGGEPATYTELPNFSSPGQPGDQPSFDPPGQSVAFTSAPVDVPTEIVGVPRLSVRLSHTAPADLVVFTRLEDVAPDGTATVIRRMVAPSRTPTAAVEAGSVDLRLPATAWRLEPGHALRLVLATTDQAFANQRLADVVTVSSDPSAPSVLTLPVVPAEAERPPGRPDAPPPSTPRRPDPAPDARAAPGSTDRSLPATGGPVPAVVGIGLVLVAARRRR